MSSYALGRIDPKKLPAGLFQGDYIPSGNEAETGMASGTYGANKPYALMNGAQLGLDNNYKYAVYPDGRVEHAYGSQGQDFGQGNYGQTTFKTASELAAEGWDYANAQKDAHGVPTPGNVGGRDYSAVGSPVSPSNNLFDTLGPSLAFGALSGPIMAAGVAGAGLTGATAGATTGALQSSLTGGNPLTGALTGGAGSALRGGDISAAGGTSDGNTGAFASGGGDVANTTTPTLSGGDPMWDWLDNYSGADTFSTDPSVGDLGGNIDPNTGMPIESGSSFGGADSPVDMFGSTPTDQGWTNDPSAWDPDFNRTLGQNWQTPTSLSDRLWGLGGSILNAGKSVLNRGRSAAGGSTAGGGGRAGAGGSGPGGMSFGDMAFNSTPFLLSAALANRQRNDINPYLDRLNSLSDRFAGNESSYLKSLTDPYDMSTARGRGDLTMRLGDRGVLGSSFGGMDLGNFDYMRDVGRGNLVSQAINQSVGAQSQLTDQAIKGINTRNAGTNSLLGAGLNASARLFSPQRDPFGVESLLRMAG